MPRKLEKPLKINATFDEVLKALIQPRKDAKESPKKEARPKKGRK